MAIMILGGSAEGRAFAENAAQNHPQSQIFYCLAGRTANPELPRGDTITTRIGGFGGVSGLVEFLYQHHINEVRVLLHPFARQMLHHCQMAQELCPNIQFHFHTRPSWGLRQYEMPIDAIIDAINHWQGRVLCALGSQNLGAFFDNLSHGDCWLRTLNPINQPHPFARIIIGKPLDYAGELALLRDHNISLLVARDSGALASFQKIQAAMDLAIAIKIIAR